MTNDSNPAPPAERKTEQLYEDLLKALKSLNFHESIKKYVKRKDLLRLRKACKDRSDSEYKGLIRRLAEKLKTKIEGKFPKSFSETIDIVEKEEREHIEQNRKQERERQNGQGVNTPQTELDPTSGNKTVSPISVDSTPVTSNTGEQGSAGGTSQTSRSIPTNQPESPAAGAPQVPAVPVGPNTPSVPANQQGSTATGNSPVPIRAVDDEPSQPGVVRQETVTTDPDSIFSRDDKSSTGSASSVVPSINGDERFHGGGFTQPALPPIEDLEQEYIAYAEAFIRRNFTGLLDPNSPEFKETMRDAARKAKEIMKKYDLTPGDAKQLTKLALYDFVILCDDSYSMMADENEEGEDRITPLKATLGRISEIATIIEPTGISIRFLNYENDANGRWDNMVGREFIENQWSAVEEDWGGITELGKKVNEKIIQPMVIQKMREGRFTKPLIVVVITDGAPTGEGEDAFKDAVINCKGSKEVMGYGEAAVIFIISKIGNDGCAESFLRQLKRCKELSEWVYCSMEKLPDDNAAVMARARMAAEAHGNKEYVKKLLEIFLAALGQQTK
ncbi:hypothetical protein TWF730_009797 [Orbilia blumenaviensis]|uniref:VWFA domain-containing protein n=1 Tax=Orbilia blumenaviensis TaxID=1796055 RepID=A0AAV9UU76_9PEZI